MILCINPSNLIRPRFISSTNGSAVMGFKSPMYCVIDGDSTWILSCVTSVQGSPAFALPGCRSWTVSHYSTLDASTHLELDFEELCLSIGDNDVSLLAPLRLLPAYKNAVIPIKKVDMGAQ